MCLMVQVAQIEMLTVVVRYTTTVATRVMGPRCQTPCPIVHICTFVQYQLYIGRLSYVHLHRLNRDDMRRRVITSIGPRPGVFRRSVVFQFRDGNTNARHTVGPDSQVTVARRGRRRSANLSMVRRNPQVVLRSVRRGVCPRIDIGPCSEREPSCRDRRSRIERARLHTERPMSRGL